MSGIKTSLFPIVDGEASPLIAEGEQLFQVAVVEGDGQVAWVESAHDGLVHFVSVDVPVAARVEVKQ